MASPNPVSFHNQPTPDPLAHFKSIPWCNALLTRKCVPQVLVPDRTPIESTDSALIRKTLNTPNTVRAGVSFLNYVKPEEGENVGEDPKNPFLQFCTLVDLGRGVNGYAKMAHGGFTGVVLDEVMRNTHAINQNPSTHLAHTQRMGLNTYNLP